MAYALPTLSINPADIVSDRVPQAQTPWKYRQAATWYWDQEVFDFVGEHLGLIEQLKRIALQQRRLRQIARAYRSSLQQSDPAAMELLERVCFFRLGATVQMLTSFVTGDDNQEISENKQAKLSQADGCNRSPAPKMGGLAWTRKSSCG